MLEDQGDLSNITWLFVDGQASGNFIEILRRASLVGQSSNPIKASEFDRGRVLIDIMLSTSQLIYCTLQVPYFTEIPL